jgi:hypothetical protein
MAEPETAQPPVTDSIARAKPPALPPALPPEPPPVFSPEPPSEFTQERVVDRTRHWLTEDGPWWLCSFVFHLILICSLALIGGKAVQSIAEEAPSFDEAKVDPRPDVPDKIERFELGETPLDPTELSTETLTLEKPAQIAQEAEFNDDNAQFEHRGGGMPSDGAQPDTGGLGGFDIKGIGPGPAVKGRGGVGVGVGTGTRSGSGGDASGFGGRGSGSRKALLGSGGGTKQSERAVAAALNWLARHQLMDGSWSLTAYRNRCNKDGTCTGPARVGEHPSAATALGLLPFLAAGQTHETKGPYRKNIAAGIRYLIANQKADGDLTMGGQMYDHGLAAIALCECYGMSNDKNVRPAAQAALNFIMDAQDPAGGGWRYVPRQAGDTSVVGWQIMALKSGQMAYLNVNAATFEKAKAFLKSVSSGGYSGGRFTYMPGGQVATGDLATTAIGLLCHQYMGMPKNDPVMVNGTAYLMKNQPDLATTRNIYYWYYATQVLHNQPGTDWDTWNRKMRRLLIDTQCRKGCAEGSWAPDAPTQDQYGDHGGRLMVTSLSALTLEVYYRFLPLYKLDRESGGAHPPAEKPPPKAEK